MQQPNNMRQPFSNSLELQVEWHKKEIKKRKKLKRKQKSGYCFQSYELSKLINIEKNWFFIYSKMWDIFSYFRKIRFWFSAYCSMHMVTLMRQLRAESKRQINWHGEANLEMQRNEFSSIFFEFLYTFLPFSLLSTFDSLTLLILSLIFFYFCSLCNATNTVWNVITLTFRLN